MDSLVGTKKVSEMNNLSMSGINMQSIDSVFIPVIKNEQDGIKNYKVKLTDISGIYLSVTLAEFNNLRSNNNLTPGHKYLISDFVSITNLNIPVYTGVSARTPYTTNVKLLGNKYIPIIPIVEALSPSTYNKTVELYGLDSIEADILLDRDNYYTTDRVPNQPNSNEFGVITRMKYKIKNIECNFDFINAISVTGSLGRCMGAPDYPVWRSGVTNRFDIIDSNDSSNSYKNKFNALNFFPIIYSNNNAIPNSNPGEWNPLVGSGIDVFIYDMMQDSDYLPYQVNGVDLVCPYYVDSRTNTNHIWMTTPSGTYPFFFFLWREAFDDHTSNIFIDKSPTRPRLTSYYRSTNIPVIYLNQKRYNLSARQDLFPYLTNNESTTTKSDISNININESDFIYLDNANNLVINKSAVLSICNVSNSKFNRCAFIKSQSIINSNFNLVAYLYSYRLDNSLFSDSGVIKVPKIIDSRLSRCLGLTSIYVNGCIENSDLRDIYFEDAMSDRFTAEAENMNDNNHICGFIYSLIGRVINSNLSNIRIINSDNGYATLMTLIELANFEYQGAKRCNLLTFAVSGSISHEVEADSYSNPIGMNNDLEQIGGALSITEPLPNFYDYAGGYYVISNSKIYNNVGLPGSKHLVLAIMPAQARLFAEDGLKILLDTPTDLQITGPFESELLVTPEYIAPRYGSALSFIRRYFYAFRGE